MANDLNITPSAYSKIERGITDPSIGRLAQIANILGVDIMYFFQGGETYKDTETYNIVSEPRAWYGTVDKEDFEELRAEIRRLKEEILLIKKELKNNSIAPPKKKK